MKTAILFYGCNCDNCCQSAENELIWKGERLVMIDNDRFWYLLHRDNGSICLYWTQINDPAQYIVWDSLDKGE